MHKMLSSHNVKFVCSLSLLSHTSHSAVPVAITKTSHFFHPFAFYFCR